MPTLNPKTATYPSSVDSSTSRVAIGAGVLATSARAVHVTTAGNIVGQLIGETVDVTETFEIGWHMCAFKSVTSATAVGFFHL